MIVVPRRSVARMFRERSTASCCETDEAGAPVAPWIWVTLKGPARRSSRIQMRSGCARALKNSAFIAVAGGSPVAARVGDVLGFPLIAVRYDELSGLFLIALGGRWRPLLRLRHRICRAHLDRARSLGGGVPRVPRQPRPRIRCR